MLQQRKIREIIRKIKNWDDFKSKLKFATAKEKGDAFELLTKYFLKLDPTYVTKLKHVWLYNEIPQKIRKYLNLPDKDQGIDLIAGRHMGFLRS